MPQPIDVRLDGARVKLFDQAGLMKGTPPAEGYTQDDLGDPDFEKNSLDGDGVLEARFFAKAGRARAGAGVARAQVGCR